MAGQTAGSGYRGNGKYRYTKMAEINVTPFVDVMLVLLIVFMVTAPLLTVGVPVDLPKTRAATINDTQEPLVVSINGEGKLFLQESETTLDNMIPRLREIMKANPDLRIFIRGDETLPYGTVMEVMGELSAAGLRKVSLLAKLPETETSKK
ncbi:MAG: protein TolR [Rhodospirillaceae bacterium]|nr:protein TolR [Rhodospirillaceae bacterium]MDD9916378.1 protein TolR [Rhodospirillaceae bacterium]MDD9927759.1 protein TolR [Rhodospirillaceae bacterium]